MVQENYCFIMVQENYCMLLAHVKKFYIRVLTIGELQKGVRFKSDASKMKFGLLYNTTIQSINSALSP